MRFLLNLFRLSVKELWSLWHDPIMLGLIVYALLLRFYMQLLRAPFRNPVGQLVAALTNHPLQGAVVMSAFALGSALVLTLGPWLWLRLRVFKTESDGAWGVRLAGLALAASAGWALWMGLVEYQAPWCVVPQ